MPSASSPAQKSTALDQLERDIDDAIRHCNPSASSSSARELLHHPDFVYERHANLPTFPPRVMEQVVIAARYGGYIERQERRRRPCAVWTPAQSRLTLISTCPA